MLLDLLGLEPAVDQGFIRFQTLLMAIPDLASLFHLLFQRLDNTILLGNGLVQCHDKAAEIVVVRHGYPGLTDIQQALGRRNGTLYTPWFWRWIMLIIKHIPEFVFVKLKL